MRSMLALWACSTSCLSMGRACSLMKAERARSVGAEACTSVIFLPLTTMVTCTGPHCISSLGPAYLCVAVDVDFLREDVFFLCEVWDAVRVGVALGCVDDGW